MKLFNLLPKEDKFYDMLQALTNQAQIASEALQHLVTPSTQSGVQERCRQEISQAKTEAKEVYYRIVAEVCQTFITPYDREDIQELATRIYFISKLINKIEQRIRQHLLINRPNNDLSRFATVIIRQSTALDELIHGLEKGLNATVIHEKAGAIYELEDQGDETLGVLLMELFAAEIPSKELILRKDLYEMLEDVTDLYRDAAAVALRIVLKHS